MKDLLLITSYCPDEVRENILRDLINSLTKFNEKYDIMIVSHTPIALDIQKKVNYFLYDSKNEILTDSDLLNQPWFSPTESRVIQSSFLSKKNTVLAMWRMMILGFSLAKNLGYSKVHQIEYDCHIIEDSEISKNSDLLGTYDSVVYFDTKDNTQEIMFGSFQSYYLPNVDDVLINLDENKIKNIIRESDTKSPEVLLYRILSRGKIYKKNRESLEVNGNKFGIFDGQVSKNLNPWSVPFYDRSDDHIYFITWNTKISNGIESQVIVNKSKIHHIDNTPLNHWKLIDLGHISEINNLLIIENNQVRDFFELSSDDEIDLFKKMSFRN
jgi:hypothetical protein